MEIGKKIVRLMEEQDMTKYRLCKKSGVSWSYINYLITGESKNPTANVLTKIAKALGVSTSVLMDEDEDLISTERRGSA